MSAVAPPSRTEIYPFGKRKGFLAGAAPTTALRIYGHPIELPLLAGQLVATLGRLGDLRVDCLIAATVDATATSCLSASQAASKSDWRA